MNSVNTWLLLRIFIFKENPSPDGSTAKSTEIQLLSRGLHSSAFCNCGQSRHNIFLKCKPKPQMPARILSFPIYFDILGSFQRKWALVSCASQLFGDVPSEKPSSEPSQFLPDPRHITEIRCYRCLADELREKPLQFPLSFCNPTVWFFNHFSLPLLECKSMLK